MIISRKGVSPLIATVLLIVFTIALGTIIIAWLTNYTSTTTEQTSATSNRLTECAKAAITIDAIYSSTADKNITKVDVRNNGLLKINVTNVVVSSVGTSCKLVATATEDMQVGDLRSFTNSACSITCNSYANTRVTTNCGTATATHTTNETIYGC